MNSSHQAVINWIEERRRHPCHRQLILLSRIEKDDCALAEACSAFFENTIWVGKRPGSSNCIQPNEYTRQLGQSRDCVIYNAYSGFRPNAVAGLEGCVQHTGLFILITPTLDAWPSYEAAHPSIAFSFGEKHFNSVFIKHFIDSVKSDSSVAIISQSICHLPLAFVKNQRRSNDSSDTDVCTEKLQSEQIQLGDNLILNQEQSSAFSDLKLSFATHNQLLGVIISPRGRGKSTLLGAIAFALRDQFKSIFLCSSLKPQSEQVVSSFELLDKNGMSTLKFIPPDQLCSTDFSQSLLIVDEAANIPSHIFLTAVKAAQYCLAATTEIGYEGTGLGFTHKIKPLLNGIHPCVRFYHLCQPIRWHIGDPLERLFFEFFSPFRDLREQIGEFRSEKLTYHFVDVENESQLTTALECFGLLMNAHYQTTQDDLMRALDAKDQAIFVAQYNQQVIGCAIIIFEGIDVDNELGDQICRGERRLSGHLATQSIASITLQPEVLKLKNWRINRIAVIPRLQSNGIGTILIERLAKQAKKENADLLSTSFGIEPRLLNFWKNSGFEITKIGPRVDKNSGLHSALMIKALKAESNFYLSECTHHWMVNRLFLNERGLLPEFYRNFDNLSIDIKLVAPTINKRLDSIKESSQLIKNNLAYVYAKSLITENKKLTQLIFDYLKKGHHKQVKAEILKEIQTLI